MYRMSIEVSCVCTQFTQRKTQVGLCQVGVSRNLSWALLQVPTLITSSRYFINSIRCVFKTVYLIILNEEKGGTCEAKLKLKDSMEAVSMKS